MTNTHHSIEMTNIRIRTSISRFPGMTELQKQKKNNTNGRKIKREEEAGERGTVQRQQTSLDSSESM